MESVTFITKDGVIIVGDWYLTQGIEPCRGALLLHMMPATKESWSAFAVELNERGISCLAIDERGHGSSTKTMRGERLDYKSMGDQTSKELDIVSALEWMKERGVDGEHLAIVGASVGANLVIRTLAKDGRIPLGVALSPVMDARRVLVADAMPNIGEGQNVLLCASEEDDPESFSAVNQLHDLNRDHSFRIILEDAGHGTTMFEKDPEFMKQIVEWVDKKLKPLSTETH